MILLDDSKTSHVQDQEQPETSELSSLSRINLNPTLLQRVDLGEEHTCAVHCGSDSDVPPPAYSPPTGGYTSLQAGSSRYPLLPSAAPVDLGESGETQYLLELTRRDQRAKRGRRQRILKLFIGMLVLDSIIGLAILFAIRNRARVDKEPSQYPDKGQNGNKPTSPGPRIPYPTNPPGQSRRHFDVESDEIVWKCTAPYDWLGDTKRDQSNALLHSAADFFLPRVSNGLSMMIQGAAGHGNLSISWDKDIDRMVVSMNAIAPSSRMFEKTTVCYHGRPESNSQALLIKTPKPVYLSPSEDVFFDINLRLPVPPPGSTFHLNELDLKLPYFSLLTEDLSDARFGIVGLDMQHAPIKLQGLSADTIIIENENEPIEGSLNVTRLLKILNANAPVTASVNLHTLPGANQPVVLSSVTSGSEVDLNLTLVTSPDNTLPSYNISTVNSDASTRVAVFEQPSDSILNFIALHHGGAIEAKMHPAFEGNFVIVESGEQQLLMNDIAPDPSQKGRRRCFDRGFTNKSKSSGSVSWQESCHDFVRKKGLVSLSNEKSNTTLWI